MKPEEAFGLVLRELRKTKKISQENLALEGSLDRTFVSLLERGLRQPSLTTILQISNALQIAPGELMNLVQERLSSEGEEL